MNMKRDRANDSIRRRTERFAAAQKPESCLAIDASQKRGGICVVNANHEVTEYYSLCNLETIQEKQRILRKVLQMQKPTYICTRMPNTKRPVRTSPKNFADFYVSLGHWSGLLAGNQVVFEEVPDEDVLRSHSNNNNMTSKQNLREIILEQSYCDFDIEPDDDLYCIALACYYLEIPLDIMEDM